MATQTYTVGSGQDYTDLEDFESDAYGVTTGGAAADDDIVLNMKELSTSATTWTATSKTGGVVTITAEAADRHDGTSGTGYGFDVSSTNMALRFDVPPANEFEIHVVGCEFDLGAGYGIYQERSGSEQAWVFSQNLFHSFSSNGVKYSIRTEMVGQSDPRHIIHIARCIFYDMEYTGTGGEIWALWGSGGAFVSWCSAHDWTTTSGTSSTDFGMFFDLLPRQVQNTACGDVSNSGSGSEFQIEDVASKGAMGCVSVQSTLSGRGAVASSTAAAMFNSPGTGDLTPKAAGPLIDAAYELAENRYDLLTDAVGRDVVTEGDVLDVGAIEYVAP